MTRERGSSIVERWFHHIVAGASLLGLSAGIGILWGVDRDVAVMQEKLSGFEAQIKILNSHTQNRYTNIDAARDREAWTETFARERKSWTEINKDQELRLRRLERDHNRALRNDGHFPNGQLRAE